jgi:hypothetical protein
MLVRECQNVGGELLVSHPSKKYFVHRKAFKCGLFSDFLALLTSKNGSVIESKGFQSINNYENWE